MNICMCVCMRVHKCVCVCSLMGRCVFMCVCVHMCVGTQGVVRIHECMCIETRGQPQLLFLWRPYCLRQWLSLAWNSLIKLGKKASKPWTCLHLPAQPGNYSHATTPRFILGFCGSNSCVYKASTVLIEPFPVSWVSFWMQAFSFSLS